MGDIMRDMELQDPRNRKMQNLIAFSVSAGIHLAGLLALLSINACGKESSSKDAVPDSAPKEKAEAKEVDKVQQDNRHREEMAPNGLPLPPGGIRPIESEECGRATTNLVVQAGDTLWTIARRCKTTPAKLAKMNGKDVKALSSLRVGQVLKVPVQ